MAIFCFDTEPARLRPKRPKTAQNGPKRAAEGVQWGAAAPHLRAMRPQSATKRRGPGPRTPRRVARPYLSIFGPFGPVLGGTPPPGWGGRSACGGAARSRKPGFREGTTRGGQPPSFGPGLEPEPAPRKFASVACLLACSYYGETGAVIFELLCKWITPTKCARSAKHRLGCSLSFLLSTFFCL